MRYSTEHIVACALMVVLMAILLSTVALSRFGVSYLDIAIVGIFLLAYILGWGKRSAELAWSVFSVGWCLALLGTVHEIVVYLSVMSEFPTNAEIRTNLLLHYCQSLGLPIALSIPAAVIALQQTEKKCPASGQIVVLAPLLAAIDVTLLALLLVLIFI